MPRSPGIIVAGSFGLSKALQPISVEVAPACWIVDVQSGPFDSRWVYASPDNENIVNRKWIDVPALADTSAGCWRPHTFPRLAEHTIVDEWSYFYAFRCAEDQVVERATNIAQLNRGGFSADFFDRLPFVADLFLMHVDGWWEYYSHHAEWRQKILAAFPGAFVRSWRETGASPMRQ